MDVSKYTWMRDGCILVVEISSFKDGVFKTFLKVMNTRKSLSQIKEEECQKVVESMPKRIQACIKAKRRWTKY